MAQHPQSRESKVAKVVGEFKRGTLKSGSGRKVVNRDQAIAIGISEASKHRSSHKKK